MTYQYLFDNKQFLKFIESNDDRVTSCDTNKLKFSNPVYIGESYYPTYKSKRGLNYIIIPSIHDAFVTIEKIIYDFHLKELESSSESHSESTSESHSELSLCDVSSDVSSDEDGQYDLLCPIFDFNPFYNPAKEVVIDFKVAALYMSNHHISTQYNYIQLALYKGLIITRYVN